MQMNKMGWVASFSLLEAFSHNHDEKIHLSFWIIHYLSNVWCVWVYFILENCQCLFFKRLNQEIRKKILRFFLYNNWTQKKSFNYNHCKMTANQQCLWIFRDSANIVLRAKFIVLYIFSFRSERIKAFNSRISKKQKIWIL